MKNILRILYFLIPIASIGVLVKYETITDSQANWIAFF